MPFIDDAGVRDEPRGPIWDAFAVLADQIERVVLVNVGWASQLLPAILSLAFPEWPGWVRLALILYSATVLAPATATLYALAAYAWRRDHLSLDLTGQLLRELTVPSLRTLAPLYGTFGVLIWIWIGLRSLSPGSVLPAALIQFALLLLLVCATYWGPLLAAEPTSTSLDIARRSARLVWSYPAETLATCGVIMIAFLIGVISIGGIFLVVPVLIAMLQTCRYGQLAERAYARNG